MQDLMAQGESALQAGILDEARDYFQKILGVDPFHARAHKQLSVIHWARRKSEDALNCLTRALELDPDDRDIILFCCKVFGEMGKDQDAREILNAYMARNPWDQTISSGRDSMGTAPPNTMPNDVAGFFNEQGETQFQNGKLVHARSCFEMAIEHNPDHAKAHCNLGALCWHEGSLEKALEHLYRALDLDSEDPDILYNSSQALTSAGEYEIAADYLKLYLQRNSKDEDAWTTYSSLLQQMGALLVGKILEANGREGEAKAVYEALATIIGGDVDA